MQTQSVCTGQAVDIVPYACTLICNYTLHAHSIPLIHNYTHFAHKHTHIYMHTHSNLAKNHNCRFRWSFESCKCSESCYRRLDPNYHFKGIVQYIKVNMLICLHVKMAICGFSFLWWHAVTISWRTIVYLFAQYCTTSPAIAQVLGLVSVQGTTVPNLATSPWHWDIGKPSTVTTTTSNSP